jgi:hypothetical protein
MQNSDSMFTKFFKQASHDPELWSPSLSVLHCALVFVFFAPTHMFPSVKNSPRYIHVVTHQALSEIEIQRGN